MVLTYLHIWIYMNRFHIYSICNKKGKVLCVIQYKFNASASSPLAYINTNYTLLAASSWTPMKVTESTSDTNLKPAMEADATSGKKNLYKNFINNELRLKICFLIYVTNGNCEKNQQSWYTFAK